MHVARHKSATCSNQLPAAAAAVTWWRYYHHDDDDDDDSDFNVSNSSSILNELVKRVGFIEGKLYGEKIIANFSNISV